jgi:hypothetical protein
MGMLDFDARFKSSYWFALSMRREASQGDRVTFSKGRKSRQITRKVKFNADRNSFEVRFTNGKLTMSLNGAEVFQDAVLKKGDGKHEEFTGDTFLLGVCALGDSGQTVIRYRNLQVRRIAPPRRT